MCSGGLFAASAAGDGDGLQLRERDHAPTTALDPDTAPLQPAEGLARHGRLMGVHPDTSGVNVPGDAGTALRVICPDRGAEAEVGGVGSCECVAEIVVANDRERRPELLLVDEPGTVGKADDYRRLEEIARTINPVPPSGDFAAVLGGVAHELINPLELHLV